MKSNEDYLNEMHFLNEDGSRYVKPVENFTTKEFPLFTEAMVGVIGLHKTNEVLKYYKELLSEIKGHGE